MIDPWDPMHMTKLKQRLAEGDAQERKKDNRSRTTPVAKLISAPTPAKDAPVLSNLDLLKELKERIIGQDHVIEEIVPLFYRFAVGLAPANAPLGTALLLGPTGTGKTALVEALAEILAGTSRAVFKVDCGEFTHGHEIAKLVGAPPGYLGHRETHAYFNQTRMRSLHTENVKANIILFDEIEKANDQLYNLLLGILDKGLLTLGDNTTINFNESFIFFTSNLGAVDMQSSLTGNYGLPNRLEAIKDTSFNRLEAIAKAAAKKHFLPEFMNRLDLVMVYKPLTEEASAEILNQVLWTLQERLLATSTHFVLRVPAESKAYLLQQGVSKDYGARELKRTVERLITRPLILKLREDPEFFKRAREVEVGVDGAGTTFKATR